MIEPVSNIETFVFGEGHMIVKFGAGVGHLNIFLVLPDGNLNKPVVILGGGGMLNFQIDQCIM